MFFHGFIRVFDVSIKTKRFLCGFHVFSRVRPAFFFCFLPWFCFSHDFCREHFRSFLPQWFVHACTLDWFAWKRFYWYFWLVYTIIYPIKMLKGLIKKKGPTAGVGLNGFFLGFGLRQIAVIRPTEGTFAKGFRPTSLWKSKPLPLVRPQNQPSEFFTGSVHPVGLRTVKNRGKSLEGWGSMWKMFSLRW